MEHGRRVQSGSDRWSEVSRRKSQSKSPQGQNWKQTIPSWEKSFCKTIGSLDWETVLEMQKFSFLFDNVVKWDCSAGEEALQNAKKRFWAESHGIQCDVSLPDPDLYIDEVDWDCEVDSDLMLDLDCVRVGPSPNENCDSVIIFGNALIPSEALPTPGWGEEEEEANFPKDDSNNCADNNNNKNNVEDPWEAGWKKGETTKQSGWGNGEWEGGWNNNSGYWGGNIGRESGWRSEWNNNTGDCNRNYGYPKQKCKHSEGRRWDDDGGFGNQGDTNYNQNYVELKGGNVHYNSFSGTKWDGRRSHRRYKGKHINSKYP